MFNTHQATHCQRTSNKTDLKVATHITIVRVIGSRAPNTNSLCTHTTFTKNVLQQRGRTGGRADEPRTKTCYPSSQCRFSPCITSSGDPEVKSVNDKTPLPHGLSRVPRPTPPPPSRVTHTPRISLRAGSVGTPWPTLDQRPWHAIS